MPVSKSYTTDMWDPEAKKKRDESWDRIFGKKKKRRKPKK